MELIIQLLSDWHLIVIFIVLLILFPTIFYLSALDKSPVRIKKVPIKKKKRAANTRKEEEMVKYEEDEE